MSWILSLLGQIYWKDAPHSMVEGRDGCLLELLVNILSGGDPFVTEGQKEDYRSFIHMLLTKYHVKLEH
jgi:hypothetical protein